MQAPVPRKADEPDMGPEVFPVMPACKRIKMVIADDEVDLAVIGDLREEVPDRIG